MKLFVLIKRLFWGFREEVKLENPETFFGEAFVSQDDTELYVKHELINLGHLLGLDFESLISSFELAKKGIEDPDPRIQSAAIEALNYFWPKDMEVAKFCTRILQSDGDEGVKAASISYLINYYDRASKEDPVVKLFAKIVTGNDSDALKSFAYLGMRRMLYGFKLKDDPLTFSFPRDVDWKMVKNIGEGTEK